MKRARDTRKSTGRIEKDAAPPANDFALDYLLRSKVAQLADYFRKSIQQGKLLEPMPGTRLWSRQLGVSRRTLNAAIQELKREGWFTVHRRGVRLTSQRVTRRAGRSNAPRRVRMLLFGAYRMHLNHNIEALSPLREQLRLRGIELSWEICTPARLREIARQPAVEHELLLLASLPLVYQRLLAETNKPAYVYGGVAPGITLPFVNVDQAGAVHHATFQLLQHGFRELALIHMDVDAVGIRGALAAFQTACAEWPRQPIVAQLVPTALDRASLLTTVRRLAQSMREPKGFIVVAPVPVGMVVTALLHHGIKIPRPAEVVALFHPAEALKLYPPLTYYPLPVSKAVKELTSVAVQFFDTGQLPLVRKTILSEIARSD